MKNASLFMIILLFSALPVSLLSQDAPDGAEIFKARCGTCHGSNGEGFAPAKIPAIDETPLTIEILVKFITEGRSGTVVHYTPIVNIDEAGAGAVAEYVKRLRTRAD